MPSRTVGVRAHRPFSAWVSLVRLVHPYPSVLVAAVTVGIAKLADVDAGRSLYVQLGFGMLLFQFAIGIANDVADSRLDAQTKPWKPIPRGVVSERAATLAAAACAGAGLVVTATLPIGAWLVGVAGLGCGLVYDAGLKRTRLSWLPYSVSFPLVPVWVYLAADAWRDVLWWVFPLGGVLGLSLYLANQAPDVAADRRVGVRGAAHRLGVSRSTAAAIALFGMASAVAVGVIATQSAAKAALAAAEALLAALLAPRATAFFGRDGLFGLLAAATAVLATLFIAAA